MKELGIDMSGKVRKQLTPNMVDQADRVIVMTDSSTHPEYLKNSAKIEYCDIGATKDQSYEFKQMIRDEIKKRITKLITEIG